MGKYEILEICVEGPESGIAAVEAGADRLEVNSALALGGLTPSTTLIKLLKGYVSVPLIAMIRPRHGLFTYSKMEFLQMIREAEDLLEAGADGIAFGFINHRGKINRERVKEFVSLADDRETVFHRAFDLLDDPIENMLMLADLGITRILTSGGQISAIEGKEIIKKLINRSKGNIEILPAGGIRPYNAEEFLRYTGATQLHSSCMRKVVTDSLDNRQISFIDKEISDHVIISTDQEKIRKLVSLKKYGE